MVLSFPQRQRSILEKSLCELTVYIRMFFLLSLALSAFATHYP